MDLVQEHACWKLDQEIFIIHSHLKYILWGARRARYTITCVWSCTDALSTGLLLPNCPKANSFMTSGSHSHDQGFQEEGKKYLVSTFEQIEHKLLFFWFPILLCFFSNLFVSLIPLHCSLFSSLLLPGITNFTLHTFNIWFFRFLYLSRYESEWNKFLIIPKKDPSIFEG